MKTLLLLIVISSTAQAADVPFYLRAIEGEKDVAAVNENFRSVVSDLGEKGGLEDGNTWAADNKFATGIVFNDGTRQTTAAVSATVSTGVVLNTSASPGLLDNGQVAMYALSADGTTLSSGCLVHIYYTSQGAAAIPVFTSTTTGSLDMRNRMPGVTMTSCVPNTNCLIGIEGVYQIQLTAAALGGSSLVETGATRCRGLALGGTADDRIVGKSLHPAGVVASSTIWMKLMQAQ